ncbi:MAG: hypothetical protein ACRCX8_15770 [Sarcina sp.]
MLIRGVPKNLDNYIKVDDTQTLELHEKGFYPKYMKGEFVYFEKTHMLMEYLHSKGKEVKN